jgi:hypothetical protein
MGEICGPAWNRIPKVWSPTSYPQSLYDPVTVNLDRTLHQIVAVSVSAARSGLVPMLHVHQVAVIVSQS